MNYLKLIPILFACIVSFYDTEFASQPTKRISEEQISEEQMYFPSNHDDNWETKSLSDLGWNANATQELESFLEQNNTKSFMILVNGRIVIESYFNGHQPETSWQWNSAGKTLVGITTGIAQQENLLNINHKVSQYLGENWTREPIQKENLINVKHLISMTTGLKITHHVVKRKLMYEADAGSKWSYNNVFQKKMDVIAAASKQDFESYFNTKLKNKLGMDGFWKNRLVFKVFYSNTRSMARFGLMALNKGKWHKEQIINESFFNESIHSSQTINPSYGYFWWLNGKTSFMVPGGQTVYQGSLIPNAPADMFAAMGAEDNRIYVIPSRKMVIIRMGESSKQSNRNFALSRFDNELWQKINAVIN